jgi:hypothetical protein
MTKKQPDASDAGWLEKFMAGTSPVDTAVPAFRPQTSPSERKADERTRAVREMTDAATESASHHRPAQGRTPEKEAQDRAQAALKPAKTKPKTKD